MKEFLVAALVTLPPLNAIFATKKAKNTPWINRKIIHLSSIPAILAHMYFFPSPWYMFTIAMFFALLQFLNHRKGKLLDWYQISGNLGEVFYCLSFAALALIPDRIYAGAVMLLMAVSDSATGVSRYLYFKLRGWNTKRRKHWVGSLAFFLTAVPICWFLLGPSGIFLAALATIAEGQRFVDDNLAVPLVGLLVKPLVV